MINFTPLNTAAYQQLRFNLISAVESVKPKAYLDDKKIPTIGIGFNLRDPNILTLVLDAFGVVDAAAREKIAGVLNASYTTNTALQSALNAEMAKLHNANPAIRATFEFSSGAAGTAEIRTVFDTAVLIYDNPDPLKPGRVDKWLAGIPLSRERSVLVSMSYNGYINEGTSPSLRKAISSGNRAEAWFEIRYNSNRLGKMVANGVVIPATLPDGKPNPDYVSYTNNADMGVAKRHYLEAELLGLYDDPTQLTPDQILEDAKSAYRMLQSHREDILKYDATYGVTPDGSTGSRGNMVANADSMGLGMVHTLTQSFEYAKLAILADLSTGTTAGNNNSDIVKAYQAWLGKGHDATSFNPTDLYLDPQKQTNSVISARIDSLTGAENTRDSIIVGESTTGNYDYLIGSNGSDLLVGGNGNDYLYGGQGDDVMAGGAGNDTYLINVGDGSDTIEDKIGDNTVIFNGEPVKLLFRQQDGSFKNASGTITAEMVGTDLKLTDLGSGQTLILNANFQEGDFGITFIDALTNPQTSTTFVGDPLIHSATIAPGGQGADWRIVGAPYNQQYTAVDDGNGNMVDVLTAYDVDYYLIDVATGNPIEGGGAERADSFGDTSGNDHIISGAGNDIITANKGGDDLLDAGSGRDTVNAYAGNDVLIGGSEGDILHGGADNDRLYAEAKVDTATAISQGNLIGTGTALQGDWLAGGEGDDTLIGSTAKDVLMGGDGTDLLIGGAGDDGNFIRAAANDAYHSVQGKWRIAA